MDKMEELHCAVVLSMKKKRDEVILKRNVDNKVLLDSKEKAMKSVIQRYKNKSNDLQNKFDNKSSLTLEKNRLHLEVERENRAAIVDSSKQNDLQDRSQSSNDVNIISI